MTAVATNVPVERESVPISALQHHAFCPRQCALIHLERQWSENTLTAEGRVLHERAHDGGVESRRDVRTTRSLHLQSTRLGLHGVADIVEFHRQADGGWLPFPVEYKRGRPKSEPIDAVQLCAQAVCLEEMMHVAIPAGAIFYGEKHRREDVVFDDQLRATTAALADAVHAMLAAARTPPAEYSAKCRRCSLLDLCRPKATARSASTHLARLMNPPD